MIPRLGLCLLVAAVVALGGPAEAKDKPVHTDAVHHFAVDIPPAFVFHPGADLLGSYQGNGALQMSLSRIAFPSLPAWRRKERDAFFDTVVAGARDSARDFHQKSRKSQRVDGVPALDLHFSRQGAEGKELVWMRFLFFRKHTIVASASTPRSARGAQRKLAKDFTRSLRPFVDAQSE